MGGDNDWSRRRFLAASSAAAGLSAVQLPGFGESAAQQGNTIPPPIVITGGVRPLLTGNTARPLRYTPDRGDFVVQNGSEFFNRPIYGAISDFRVDAGDRPEFSLYLPGHGGNLKLGFVTPAAAKWMTDAGQVVARYRPGRMLYEIRDAALGDGIVNIELMTMTAGSGLMAKVEALGVPVGTSIAFIFGGCSGRKGRRNGDIGCEVEPVSQFFQVRPEECSDNTFTDGVDGNGRPISVVNSPAGELRLTFPQNSRFGAVEFSAWQKAPTIDQNFLKAAKLPVLTGTVAAGNGPLYFAVQHRKGSEAWTDGDPAVEFEARSKQVAEIAATITLKTPDPYIDAMGPALGIVAEALWDPKQECVMHGCVAWRVALAGWRGPYVLDATGAHDRAKLHFRHWLKKQNVKPITTGDPATGPADAGTRLSRKESLLHSNGDLSNNHYDMNLVCFDALLRHLRWTGDLDFAREVWSALQRHLAWEHRLFRRTFMVEGRELPLYEAYAAIWASDNLQYSGGGAAHSSAYNLFALRLAAHLARLLDEDATAYQVEADLLHEGMQKLLWLPKQGAFAEAKDLMGPQTVYNNPALWTVYHSIDSEVPEPRQSWQMVAERLAVLKRIPVHGEGVPAGEWFMLACTDWLPYMWSLTLVLLGENMHFALAMWQAGMVDEAYKLFKGALLDSMYMGLCPGDFHMTSALDAHRQEAQRDFGDPTGISARALVEGLFGVQPDLIGNAITVRLGFPSDWDHAELHHKDFDFAWRRDGASEVVEFTSRFAKRVPMTLVLRARTTTLPVVTADRAPIECSFEPSAVGAPMVLVKLKAAERYSVRLTWRGKAPMPLPEQRTYALGAVLEFPRSVTAAQIDDPQGCLREGKTAAAGFHTVFANMQQGSCRWSMPISFTVTDSAIHFPAMPRLADAARVGPIDLAPFFTHGVTEIFARSYAQPRSPLCTLSIPDTLLGGWANIGEPVKIDDSGLRNAGGMLKTPLGVGFRTPAGTAPNCVLLSYFEPDKQTVTVPLSGHAKGIYLLVTGTTLPQCSRMQHALVTVSYNDGIAAKLSLRNPETWWPIEQDYLLDDYLFIDDAPLPPRVSLRTGETRLLAHETFNGKGREVAGGAATILYLPIDPGKTLASLQFEVNLYGIVVALLGATLVRA